MKKKPVSVYLRGPLRKWVERRVGSPETPYKGPSAYFEAAVLCDLIIGLPHSVLSQLMGQPERVRDKMVEEMLEHDGNLPDGWVKERIEKLTSEIVKTCDLKRKNGKKRG